MTRAHPASALLGLYIAGLPVWWMLGADFLMPLGLALLLMLLRPWAHQRFTLFDHLLAAIALTLGVSAFLNGFLVASEPVRFVAALYNLSFWVCGLVVVQQARATLRVDPAGAERLLRTAFYAFLAMAAFALGVFVLAYVVGQFFLTLPSGFGLVVGEAIPESAAIVRQSTRLVFTRPDWGLPGIPTPRVVIYGPYPTATGATVAVLGTLALLYLIRVKRAKAWPILAVEGLIVLVLALTLTRSILGGWLVGMLIANLVFGTIPRRLVAAFALLLGLLAVVTVDVTDLLTYRQYSSESRFANYVRAVKETLAFNPVLGMGIKPREEGNHIPIGSHSTFVSTFTKGGTLGLCLVLSWVLLLPALRWGGLILRAVLERLPPIRGPDPAELRVLFNLQIAIWVWLGFEDLDAPATAAMLIFLSFAFITDAFWRVERAQRPLGAAFQPQAA